MQFRLLHFIRSKQQRCRVLATGILSVLQKLTSYISDQTTRVLARYCKVLTPPQGMEFGFLAWVFSRMGLSNEAADEMAKEDVTCEKMTSVSATQLRFLFPEQVFAMTTPNKNYKLKTSVFI